MKYVYIGLPVILLVIIMVSLFAWATVFAILTTFFVIIFGFIGFLIDLWLFFAVSGGLFLLYLFIEAINRKRGV
jgi:hypothetical protein